MSLKSKGLSRVFSNTTVQKNQFFCSAFFIVQLSHPYMTTGETIALTRLTLVSKVMSLLLNMLSRLAITFLPRSKVKVKESESEVAQLCPTLCDPMDYNSPRNSLGQNTGVGSLSLLQGIFPTQGSNPGLSHCRQIHYQLNHKEAQKYCSG